MSREIIQTISVLRVGETSRDYFCGFTSDGIELGEIDEAVAFEDERAILSRINKQDFEDFDIGDKGNLYIERLVRRYS
jgi:hypothetical protein